MIADEPVIFSVTGDVPYDANEVLIFQQHLDDHDLYSPAEFFVHLGDIKLGVAPCDESYYRDMATMLRSLSVPAFIVPGDNEWTDCLDRVVAWQYWTEHLMGLEGSFCGVPNVQKQVVRPENFAFVHKGVLFIGLNLVGGGNVKEVMQDDADWVRQQFTAQAEQVRAAVVFAQAGPGSNHNTFFDRFVPDATAFAKPVLLLHGDGHVWIQDLPFTAANVTRVQVERGVQPPVQVTVTATGEFVLERNPWPLGTQPLDQPPCAEAGPDQLVPAEGVASLDGMASDDGEPGPLAVVWSFVSGPGTVLFADTTAAATTATFSDNGTYVLRLSVNDGLSSASDEVNVYVGAFGPNQTPLARRDTYEVDVDHTLWVAAPGVLANDTDQNGDILFASVVTPPQHGELQLDSDGSFSYVPAVGFMGLDVFVYRASDTVAESGAEVWIGTGGGVVTFVGAADAKVRSTTPTKNYGNSIDLRVEEDDPAWRSYLKFNVTNVGSVRDGILRLSVQNASDNGGSLYAVSNNYEGTGTPWTETGINWYNAPLMTGAPVTSVSQSVTAGEVVPFPLARAITSAGTWSFGLFNASTNDVVYGARESTTPPELILCALPVGSNLPPVAAADAYAVPEDSVLAVTAPGVLANDADEDGDPLQVSVTAPPQHGTLVLGADGGFTYTPAADYCGADAFAYIVDDNRGGTDTGIVSLAVLPRNDAPEVVSEVYIFGASEGLTLPAPGVLANDTDADGDMLTAALVALPQHGTLGLGADGSFVYTPSADNKGFDRFTYEASDGEFVAQATVTLRVPRGPAEVHTFEEAEGFEGGGEAAADSTLGGGSLRFKVRDLGSRVQEATLRLPCDAATQKAAPEVRAAQESAPTTLVIGWEQSAGALGSLQAAPVVAGGWIELDVTSALVGDGLYRFDLPAAALPCAVRESGGARAQLVVVTASSSTPDATAAPVTEAFVTGLGRIVPNPLRTGAWIEYGLARNAQVEIAIYNARGQRIRLLTAGPQPPGHQRLYWNGADDRGLPAATGIYFLRARLGEHVTSRKLVLSR